MKKWSWLVAPAIVIALAAMPAHAVGKGGGKGNQAPTATPISIADGSQQWLGGTVSFNTQPVGLAGWEYAVVRLVCSQGGQRVYAEIHSPGEPFVLGGTASAWVTNKGDATCQANLDAMGWKAGQEFMRTLGYVQFDAAG